MSSYFCGDNFIQVKDSSKGASKSNFCKKCENFENCQEGVFSLMCSANKVLSFSGCMNSMIHFNLDGIDDTMIQNYMKKLLEIMYDKLDKEGINLKECDEAR